MLERHSPTATKNATASGALDNPFVHQPAPISGSLARQQQSPAALLASPPAHQLAVLASQPPTLMNDPVAKDPTWPTNVSGGVNAKPTIVESITGGSFPFEFFPKVFIRRKTGTVMATLHSSLSQFAKLQENSDSFRVHSQNYAQLLLWSILLSRDRLCTTWNKLAYVLTPLFGVLAP